MANQPADGKASDHRVAIATAVIGAVATLGASIITGVVAYNAGSTAPDATTTVTAMATTTVTTTATSTVTSQPAGSSTEPTTEAPRQTTERTETAEPPPPAGGVRFQGTVALQQDTSGARTDLDLEQPTRSEQFIKGDVYAWGLTRTEAQVDATPGYSLVAAWTGTGTPGFEQCRQTALSEGVGTVRDVGRGSIICIRTSDYRIARMTVVEVLSTGIRADTVVWNEQVA